MAFIEEEHALKKLCSRYTKNSFIQNNMIWFLWDVAWSLSNIKMAAVNGEVPKEALQEKIKEQGEIVRKLKANSQQTDEIKSQVWFWIILIANRNFYVLSFLLKCNSCQLGQFKMREIFWNFIYGRTSSNWNPSRLAKISTM